MGGCPGADECGRRARAEGRAGVCLQQIIVGYVFIVHFFCSVLHTALRCRSLICSAAAVANFEYVL